MRGFELGGEIVSVSLSSPCRTRQVRPTLSYSLRLPLGLDSLLGVAFGSAALDAEASEDFDSEELLSDFDSDLDSEDFDPELLSDLDSEPLLSDAADFLYESLR